MKSYEIRELLEEITVTLAKDNNLHSFQAGYFKGWLSMLIEDYPATQRRLLKDYREITGKAWVSGEMPIHGDSTPVNIEI